MSWFHIPKNKYNSDRVPEPKPKKNPTQERSRPRQSRIPKKPRFEPKTKIIPGKHEVIFEKASEYNKISKRNQ